LFDFFQVNSVASNSDGSEITNVLDKLREKRRNSEIGPAGAGTSTALKTRELQAAAAKASSEGQELPAEVSTVIDKLRRKRSLKTSTPGATAGKASPPTAPTLPAAAAVRLRPTRSSQGPPAPTSPNPNVILADVSTDDESSSEDSDEAAVVVQSTPSRPSAVPSRPPASAAKSPSVQSIVQAASHSRKLSTETRRASSSSSSTPVATFDLRNAVPTPPSSKSRTNSLSSVSAAARPLRISPRKASEDQIFTPSRKMSGSQKAARLHPGSAGSSTNNVDSSGGSRRSSTKANIDSILEKVKADRKRSLSSNQGRP